MRIVPLAEVMADALGFHHQPAGPLGLLDLHLDGPRPLAALAADIAHGQQRADAALIASPPGLDLAANPDLLLGQPLVELRPLHGLGLQGRLLAGDVGVVVAGPACQQAPVQLDDPRGQLAEEDAVVGHQENRTGKAKEELFQPGDGVQVQVVGGLVEQEHVRLGGQRPGQEHAAFHAGGEHGNLGARVQPHAAEHGLDLVVGQRTPTRAADGRDGLEDRARQVAGHFLNQHLGDQPLLADDLALVGFQLALEQPQQGQLALAVAAQQAEPLAAVDHELDPVQHTGTAKTEAERLAR